MEQELTTDQLKQKMALLENERDYYKGIVTEKDDLLNMRKILAHHYKEPVRPVSEYCETLYIWVDALKENIKLHDKFYGQKIDELWQEYGEEFWQVDGELWNRKIERDKWKEVVDAADMLVMPIVKSNLLYRLMYQEQDLRTEMCPVHKGRWSGCSWDDDPCECNDSGNVTGWLPNKPSMA